MTKEAKIYNGLYEGKGVKTASSIHAVDKIGQTHAKEESCINFLHHIQSSKMY